MRRDSFVSDGPSRLARAEAERVRTDVARKFEPLLEQATGLRRLELKFGRWRETRKRIASLRVQDSKAINWISR